MLSPRTGPHSEISLKRLSERIAQGESPQDLLDELVYQVQPKHDDQGFTIIDTDRMMTKINLSETLPLLLKHGAHIATPDKGCAFARLFSVPEALVLLPAIKLIDKMLEAPGELPLHIFARDRPRDLHEIMPKDVLHRPAHMQKRDPHGRTVSHYLWAPDGVLVRIANQLQASPENKQARQSLQDLHGTTMQAVWHAQDIMQELGVEMTIPDNQGITALDLCNDRIQAGDAFLLPDRICRLVESWNSEKSLSCSTPMASARPPCDCKSQPG